MRKASDNRDVTAGIGKCGREDFCLAWEATSLENVAATVASKGLLSCCSLPHRTHSTVLISVNQDALREQMRSMMENQDGDAPWKDRPAAAFHPFPLKKRYKTPFHPAAAQTHAVQVHLPTDQGSAFEANLARFGRPKDKNFVGLVPFKKNSSVEDRDMEFKPLALLKVEMMEFKPLLSVDSLKILSTKED